MMNSQRISSLMVPLKIFVLIAFLIVQTLPITAQAQQETTVFALPAASISSLYQVNIEQALRETHRLRLQSSSQAQRFRWYFQSGALPPGLWITPDGNIVGRPRSARPEPYQFKLRVVDSIGRSDELMLVFELKVEPSRIRLVSTDAPRLVPDQDESETPSGNGGARISFIDRVAPFWNANHSQAEPSSGAATIRAPGSTSASRAQQAESPRYAAVTGNGRLPIADRELLVTANSVTTTTAAPAVADPSCPSCLPNPPPDEAKDFIINARTAETSGKKKFRLHDNARIIVKEKNPFLYEYKVTLKDKVIVESAVAEFFGKWALFADDLKEDESATAAGAQANCSQLDQQYPAEVGRIRDLLKSLAQVAPQLKRDYRREKEKYEPVAQSIANDKEVIYDQNSSCSTVSDRATRLRTTAQHYQPDLEALSEATTDFKVDADQLKRRVKQLEQLITDNPQPNSNLPPVQGFACDAVVNDFEINATGYVETANELDAGVKKIESGKKTFDAIVKTINKVFSDPHAFYQIYTRGEYGLPTNVEITVERKDITNKDAAFVKIIDAETINFGGGARFALAGGIVVSPLETVNFKRVPALVNGQQTTIVGREEGSNSRILPMLMLHGRFADSWKSISGFHFSLGVTAKPTDSETNVEFLIGPSISFIEERLFFTVGGYAGRRKELEGNLVPGQVLPDEFGDEIPTSNHLVWKPGFALTYKFK